MKYLDKSFSVSQNSTEQAGRNFDRIFRHGKLNRWQHAAKRIVVAITKKRGK